MPSVAQIFILSFAPHQPALPSFHSYLTGKLENKMKICYLALWGVCSLPPERGGGEYGMPSPAQFLPNYTCTETIYERERRRNYIFLFFSTRFFDKHFDGAAHMWFKAAFTFGCLQTATLGMQGLNWATLLKVTHEVGLGCWSFGQCQLFSFLKILGRREANVFVELPHSFLTEGSHLVPGTSRPWVRKC